MPHLIIQIPLASCYVINGPTESTLDRANAQNYPQRTGEVSVFTGALVDHRAHQDYTAQLPILHRMRPDQLDQFDGNIISRVNCIPNIFDKIVVDAR